MTRRTQYGLIREKVPVEKFVFQLGKVKVKVVLGDITLEKVDCVVNAANSALIHGGGVAGAVKRRGGRELVEASRALMKKRNGKKVPVGGAVYTTGGKMFAKYCIHGVGPFWRGGNSKERQRLRSVIFNILKIGEKLNAKSISIPAISSGIFGYPKNIAVLDISNSIIKYFSSSDNNSSSIEEIRLTNRDGATTKLFLNWWKNYSKNGNIIQKEEEEEEKEKKRISDNNIRKKPIRRSISSKKNIRTKKKKKKIMKIVEKRK